jgi:Spy/CpxP family protein refolding chaperone
MFLRVKSTVAGLTIGLATFGAVAFAQQPVAPAQNPSAAVQQPRPFGPQAARQAMRRRAFAPMLAVLRQLNLTNDQKQQVQGIVKNTLESTKTQRQQLRQLTLQWRQGTLTPDGLTTANQLHKQLADTKKAMRGQIAGVLTPDQKTKLQDIIKQRKANPGLGKPGLG